MDQIDFNERALQALARDPGAWHCLDCWAKAAGLTSAEDKVRLRRLARGLATKRHAAPGTPPTATSATRTTSGQPPSRDIQRMTCKFGHEHPPKEVWRSDDAFPRGHITRYHCRRCPYKGGRGLTTSLYSVREPTVRHHCRKCFPSNRL